MSKWEWAAVVWGTLATLFAVAEILAALGLVPWPTLSSTVKTLEGMWVWAVFFVVVGLNILNAHLTWHYLPALWRDITGSN